MAKQLIDSMTVAWDPERYVDDYRQRLTKLVDKHLAKKQGLVRESEAAEHDTEDAATNVVDFMALLKNSLGRKGRASASPKAADDDNAPAARPRKAAGKMTATKKTAKPAPKKQGARNSR
jgi:DNA end-binding protein Ku